MNCRATLAGRFCHACGQKDLGSRLSLREVLWEFFSEVFEVEGRLPNTVFSLLFRPGHYLRCYLAGQRTNFSSPLRFYLLAAFVAVLVVGSAGERGVESVARANGLTLSVHDDTSVNVGFNSSGARRKHFVDQADHAGLDWRPVLEDPDHWPWLPTLDADPTLMCPPAPRADESLRDVDVTGIITTLSYGRTEAEVAILFLKGMLSWVPLLLSVQIAWTALLLKLLFFRDHSTTHLLTAVMFHGILLWCLTIVLLVPWWSVLALVTTWFTLHVTFGLRAAYATGWRRTLLSTGLLAFCWLVGFVAALFAALLLAILDLRALT